MAKAKIPQNTGENPAEAPPQDETTTQDETPTEAPVDTSNTRIDF